MAKSIRVAVDSLKNFVANLNTTRDKQSAADYFLNILTDEQLSAIYRTSWMAKKTVNIPAQDATRRWREWMAESDQIELLSAEEKRLGIQRKVLNGLASGRLFGGAGIYFSIKGDNDPSLPVNPERVRKGGLAFATVLSRRVLQAGDVENDPLVEGYGLPKFYRVTSGTGVNTEIHPSRIILFGGAPVLDPETSIVVNAGWEDSVLQAAYDVIRTADATAMNISSLVYEAKVDVLKIPALADIMADQQTRVLLEQRIALCAQLKGNNGMLVIDGEEEYEQKSFTFAGLPDINRDNLQAVAGAADIPITRFLGQTPSGLSSTGESDLKNYYDSVASAQTLILSPALQVFDECLIRSALGTRPDDISYEWASLWQMTDTEKSAISKQTAETISILASTKLFPDEALARAAATVIVEHSILPAFEVDEEDFGSAEEEEAAASVTPPAEEDPAEEEEA